MEELAFKKAIDDDSKKKVSEKLLTKEYAYWLYFMLSIMLKCMYFQFTTKINTQPVFSPTNITMFLVSFFILLIITSPIILFFNKGRLTALLVCNFIISVLLTSDTNFFRYYYSILTVPVILQVDLKLLSSINQSIMSLFNIKDIVYIVDLPFLFLWFINFHKKGVEKIEFAKRAIGSFLSLLIGFSGFLSVYRKIDMEAFVYSSNYVAKKLGVIYSHYDNTKIFVKESIFEDKELTPKEKAYIQKYFSKKPKTDRKFRGIAKGKNLIVVQVEALQEFMINAQVNGKEITPNLNRLLEESLYFNNIYYQVAGGNTSDAEFVFNTSLFPVKEGAVYIRYPENTYHSLPKILKNQGYNTYALHAFTAKFWNRTEMYKALGFCKFIDADYYVMDEFAGWEGSALSDSSFFRQSFDKIDMSKPFYSFFITLSSHYPFTYFEDYDFDVGEWQGTFLGNFIKAINYEDKCLGEFINQLKERGLYDNSLLVIYGDHSGVPKHKADELMEFLGLEYSEVQWVKLQKVPCIIHYPGLKNGERVSITGGGIDLLPTIANLMDLEAPYVLGKDLLNSEKGYVILRNGNVVTDNYVYLNELGEVYSIKDEKLLNKKDYEKELKTLLEKLYISDLIIEKNVFNELK
ncbi:MAG: LTA synthase family protein [Firmicutes bacterium]|nr:LTA synthase family protein [Bacillota bacterium]